MSSIQYFQPMVHVPLTKIDNVSYLSKPMNEYLVYPKPVGIDVYMVNGKIYDFNHREMINQTLLFTFEKILTTTRQMQSLFIGTLCSIVEPTKIIKHSPLLYMDTNSLPPTVRYIVYDVVFPYFNKVMNPFWIRNDIVRKTLEKTPHCSVLDVHKFETGVDFRNYIKEKFNVDRHASFILFDKEGQYNTGERQLTYGYKEQVSFELSASQKYRSHIHKILPMEVELSTDKKVKVACSIEAKFKGKTLTIPIIRDNYILQKNMWDKRKELKRMPFIFEGIYFEENDDDFEILGLHYSKFIL
jgi:hypothetical protein